RVGRAIGRGHPWVFRHALAGAPRLPDGAVVQLASRNGRPLAIGFWDARSPIAVRVLGDATAIGDVRPLVGQRIAAALARRLALIDRRETDAFRWIHGEADGLPGVPVDLYGEAASVLCEGA